MAGKDQSAFRRMSINLSRNLEDQDVVALKFLCLDSNIGLRRGELERVKEGLDLFDLLERRALLSSSNLKTLIELLGLIRRPGLQRQVLDLRGTEEGLDEKTISPYRRMMLDFAFGIGEEELKLLKRRFKSLVPPRNMQRIKEPLTLMMEFEKVTAVGPKRVDILFEIADCLKREDLAGKVKEYNEGRYF